MRPLALRAAAAGAGLVALVSIARADAPPGQYRVFNRSDVVIIDNGTQLTWQRAVVYQATSFADATSYCAGLALSQTPGWRVPSYKELLTLVDESPHTEYPTGAPVQIAIDASAFPGTPVDQPYWTSSVYLQGATSAYAVRFSDGAGLAVLMATPGYYVRCVHD